MLSLITTVMTSTTLFLLSGMHHAPPPPLELTAKQERCLTRNIWHEARGESFISQLWVSQTTVNRSNNPKFPNSICGAVHQKGAFSWYHTLPKSKHRVQPVNKLEEKAYKQIQFVIETTVILNKMGIDVTGGSLYYHTVEVKPYWSDKMLYLATVGSHRYFKEKE